jgi:Rrf2 family protein
MLKLTKKADYGLMAMKHLAEHADSGACSAKDVAESYSIPPEALAKIMQRLVKAGLLVSQHGTHGGYTLAFSRARGRSTRLLHLAAAHLSSLRVLPYRS